MTDKISVCIMGAGVGGLAAAHELSKDERYDITVYDRNHVVGGQSRSNMKDGKHSEYCWHAISSGYRNLPRLLHEIPLKDETVLTHLKPLEKYFFLTKHGEHIDYNKNFLSASFFSFFNILRKLTGQGHKLDALKAIWLYMKIHGMCQERLDNEYDDIKWIDYVSHFSDSMKRWIVDSTSIYLGMEYDEINAHLIIDLVRHNQPPTLLSEDSDFYSFDDSINEVWFNPWKEYLREQGVKFLMHHDIEYVDFTDDKKHINKLIIKDTWWNRKKEVTADIFINGLSAESLGYLTERTEYQKLAEIGHQIQTQILYRLPYRINEKRNTVYILPDTPWFLMTRHEGSLWDLKDKDLLSTGIGIWNKPGLNGKTALECSPKELAKECWDQMLEFEVPFPVNLPEWDIWNNFEYSEEEHKIWTWEPKFSNNIGSLKLRPHNKDDQVDNLYHANSYVRTSMNIFNMESGVEAGIETAKLIAGNDAVVYPSYKPRLFFRIIQWFDRQIYKSTRKR
jgi:uncharacterized protein with NAD-binding domain and iron-sulfur cluster